jgi:hypothetical protein
MAQTVKMMQLQRQLMVRQGVMEQQQGRTARQQVQQMARRQRLQQQRVRKQAGHLSNVAGALRSEVVAAATQGQQQRRSARQTSWDS